MKILAHLVVILINICIVVSIGDFFQEFNITWGDGRAQISEDGQTLSLSLDKYSGSGFQSNNQYLFGKIVMRIKLVAGDSAGIVTAYYLSSEGNAHDEMDYEFLGNSSGDPYTLQTNIFTQGKGNREQQFRLWFDPTQDFHTYTLLWNPLNIVFSVDGTPIRIFKNLEAKGIPYPKSQPMRVYSSLWNADDWATQGGRVKTDWSLGPFTASYQNFYADACIWSSDGSSSCSSDDLSQIPWMKKTPGKAWLEAIKWVQEHHMIYNYCTDTARFPQGLPPECSEN